MFLLTSVHVLSVVKIAPVNCASTGSALGAKNNPATITASAVNTFAVVFIYSSFFLVLSGEAIPLPVQDVLFQLCQPSHVRSPGGVFRVGIGFPIWRTFYGKFDPKFLMQPF